MGSLRAVSFLFLTVVALSLVSSEAARADASPSPAGNPKRLAATGAAVVPPAVSYQGHLTDAGGQPANGSHDFTFQVWDDTVAGSQQGADISLPAVPVIEGVFSVALPLDQGLFDGRALWLRLGVDGQWLSPRQPLLAAPYALGLRPGARLAGDLAAPALAVTYAGASAPAILAAGESLGLDALGQTAVRAVGRGVGVEAEGMTGLRASGDVGVSASGPSAVVPGPTAPRCGPTTPIPAKDWPPTSRTRVISPTPISTTRAVARSWSCSRAAGASWRR